MSTRKIFVFLLSGVLMLVFLTACGTPGATSSPVGDSAVPTVSPLGTPEGPMVSSVQTPRPAPAGDADGFLVLRQTGNRLRVVSLPGGRFLAQYTPREQILQEIATVDTSAGQLHDVHAVVVAAGGALTDTLSAVYVSDWIIVLNDDSVVEVCPEGWYTLRWQGGQALSATLVGDDGVPHVLSPEILNQATIYRIVHLQELSSVGGRQWRFFTSHSAFNEQVLGGDDETPHVAWVEVPHTVLRSVRGETLVCEPQGGVTRDGSPAPLLEAMVAWHEQNEQNLGAIVVRASVDGHVAFNSAAWACRTHKSNSPLYNGDVVFVPIPVVLEGWAFYGGPLDGAVLPGEGMAGVTASFSLVSQATETITSAPGAVIVCPYASGADTEKLLADLETVRRTGWFEGARILVLTPLATEGLGPCRLVGMYTHDKAGEVGDKVYALLPRAHSGAQ